MNAHALNPPRALAQCGLLGLTGVAIVALMGQWLSWTTVGQALLTVLVAFFHGVTWAMFWVVLSPVSFVVTVGAAFLSMGCLLYKIRHHQIALSEEDEHAWTDGTLAIMLMLAIYVILSVVIGTQAWLDQSDANYVDSPTLHAQIGALNEASDNATFADQVREANRHLSQYGYTDLHGRFISTPEKALVLVDDAARVATFQGVLNRRTCQDLGQPAARFVAVEVNGQTIRSKQDLNEACHSPTDNAVILRNRPEVWSALRLSQADRS